MSRQDKRDRSAPAPQFHSGLHISEKHYLTDWFVGAAREQLSVARHQATTAGENSSPVLCCRVAALMFAAAAVEAWLGVMADEAFYGDKGLPAKDFHGVVAKAYGAVTRGGNWWQRLNLTTLLWSAGNAWVLDEKANIVQRVGSELVDLRNRLIHPKPWKHEPAPRPRHPQYEVLSQHRASFSRGPAADLPAPLVEELAHEKVERLVDAAEELIARLRSLKDLPDHHTIVTALGDAGSDPYYGYDPVRPWNQVRWCPPTKKYVVHSLRVMDQPHLQVGPRTPVEDSRTCERASKCRKRRECPWDAIRTSSSQPNDGS